MPRTTAFAFLCSALAVDKSQAAIGNIRDLCTSRSFGWESVIVEANRFLLGPALYYELHTAGITPHIEAEAAEYLQGLFESNSHRMRTIREQLKSAATALSKERITATVLKGGSYLTGALQSRSGTRMCVDLDLWLDPADFYRGVAALTRAGYHSHSGIWHMERTSSHYPALAHRHFPALLELHQHPASLRSKGYFEESAIRSRRLLNTIDQEKVYLASPADQLLLNVLHSQFEDQFFFRSCFPLKALYDFVTLATSHREQIVWQHLEEALEGTLGREVLASYLQMAEDLLGWQRPAELSMISRWHYPLCQRSGSDLKGRKPIIQKALNILLGTAGMLRAGAIQERFYCGDSMVVLNYFRLKRLAQLFRKSIASDTRTQLLRTADNDVPAVSSTSGTSFVRFELEDASVLFDPAQTNIHLLSKDGTAIWEALASGIDADRIAQELTERFDIDQQKAYADVQAVSRLFEHPVPIKPTETNLLASFPRFSTESIAAVDSSKPRHVVHYMLLGMVFEIRLPDDISFYTLHKTLGHLRTEPVPLPAAVVTVRMTVAGNYALSFKRRPVALLENAQQLIPLLVSELQRYASSHYPHWLAVHAAAVEQNNKVVLLPGRSGSGKSTLLTYLSFNGWNCISDDIAVLSLEGDAPATVPVPIGIKAGSWETLHRTVPGMPETEVVQHPNGRKLRFVKPPSFYTGLPKPIDCIVFPSYTEHGTLHLSEISKGEALLRLSDAGFQPSWKFNREFVSRLLSWLSSCGTYSLSYASVEDAGLEIERLTGNSSDSIAQAIGSNSK